MAEEKETIGVLEGYFRKRVQTEAGLGWVAFPERYSTPNGGLEYRFSTADRTTSFPSIKLSAGDLAVASQAAQLRLAAQKWRICRAQYAAEQDPPVKVRRGAYSPRMGSGR